MLLQGVFLMFVGMGVVFIFLVILIVTVLIVSKIVNKLFPETEEGAFAPALAAVHSGDAEIAVAVAAVKAFTKS